MKDAVLETFAKLGEVKHMVAWAKENPSDFYRIAAKLIPQQIQQEVTNKRSADDLTTDQIIRRIEALEGDLTPPPGEREPAELHKPH